MKKPLNSELTSLQSYDIYTEAKFAQLTWLQILIMKYQGLENAKSGQNLS